MKVAIIGAGLAGLRCGQVLQAAGVSVSWFEKSRAVAGRMSAKRLWGGHVDLGAQYFTARNPAFIQQVHQWQQAGLVAPWLGSIYRYQDNHLVASPDSELRYVGMPAMHSPLRANVPDTAIQLNCRITELQYTDNWQLTASDGSQFTGFDQLVLAIPPAQARNLLTIDTGLQQQLPSQLLLPCHAVALQLSQAISHEAAAIFVRQGPLCWAARHSSKPGRLTEHQQWVLHFNAGYSQQHVDTAAEQLISVAASELSTMLAEPVQVKDSCHHRWLYASVANPAEQPGLLKSDQLPCLVIGDWCFGGRVENAWLAGQAAAEELLNG
ncbi:MAG: FAD-dependent oxidoreductase [Alkalimonas sp.]|nr:FAD-dependent oxidoreductase [Alkalimonas sp.]